MRKALAIPHIVLGIAGCIPVLGAISDLLDGILCLIELDFVCAAFSFGCAAASFVTPGADQALGILKTTRSAVRLGNVVSAGNALKNVSKSADIAKGASNVGDVASVGSKIENTAEGGIDAFGNLSKAADYGLDSYGGLKKHLKAQIYKHIT